MNILGEILRGGAEKAQEAGVLIVGGHTIDDPEPKYGLAVTGIVTPGHQVTNAGARPGDALVLTKPLGMGILTTAHKQGRLDQNTLEKIVRIMAALNRDAAEAMVEVGVHACTDITGFGLLGHLKGVLDASHAGAVVRASAVPILSEVWELVHQGVVPGGTGRNMAYLEGAVLWHPEIGNEMRIVLCDAQTSGGLLISLPAPEAPRLLEALRRRGVEGWLIGRITDSRSLVVEP